MGFSNMYNQKEVFEPIEVIVDFSRDGVKILKFKWRDKIHTVIGIRNTWQIPQNDGMLTCYSVVSKRHFWELCFHHSDLKWELNQYDTLK